MESPNLNKVELLAYLNKGQLFDKLRLEKQKMKISCVKKCLNFDEAQLNSEEQQCLEICRRKIDNFLVLSDQVYEMKFYSN